MLADENRFPTQLRFAIPTDGVTLRARFVAPIRPRAVVVLATPQAEDRLDDPARWLTSRLGGQGLGLLAVGLLDPSERADARRRLDAFLLARRIEAVAAYLRRLPVMATTGIGYLGEGTAAAGALLASLEDPRVRVVISWRGRPELAEGIFHRVSAPTLVVTDSNADARSAARRHFGRPRQLVSADQLEGPTSARGSVDHAAVAWLSRQLGLNAPERRCTSIPVRHPSSGDPRPIRAFSRT